MTAAEFRALRVEAGCAPSEWALLLGYPVHTIYNAESGTPIGAHLAHMSRMMADARMREVRTEILREGERVEPMRGTES